MKKWTTQYKQLVIVSCLLAVILISYLYSSTETPHVEIVGVFIGAVALVITFIQMAEGNKVLQPLNVDLFIWLKVDRDDKEGRRGVLSLLIKNNGKHHISNPVVHMTMPKSLFISETPSVSIEPSHVSFYGYTCKVIFDHFAFLQGTQISGVEYEKKIKTIDSEFKEAETQLDKDKVKEKLFVLKSCTDQLELLINTNNYSSGQMKFDLMADNFAPVRFMVSIEDQQELMDYKRSSERKAIRLSAEQGC